MTATAIENDQEQGNEQAEGRTGIEAEGGSRAAGLRSRLAGGWLSGSAGCGEGQGGRSSWGSVTVVGQGCHLELFSVCTHCPWPDPTGGAHGSCFPCPGEWAPLLTHTKGSPGAGAGPEAGTQWVPCAGHLERGEASQDARDGKLTRAAGAWVILSWANFQRLWSLWVPCLLLASQPASGHPAVGLHLRVWEGSADLSGGLVSEALTSSWDHKLLLYKTETKGS